MGLSLRKRSGRIIAGSRLIVEDQPILSAKVFDPGFNGKIGSLPNEHRESPTTTTTTIQPTTTTTTTIEPSTTPTVTPTNTPTKTTTPTPTNTPTSSISVTPTPTKTPTPTPTPTSNIITFNVEVGNDGDFFRWGGGASELGSTDVTINWGDGSSLEYGTIPSGTTLNFQYTYPLAGNYTVSVSFSDPLNVIAIYADQND